MEKQIIKVTNPILTQFIYMLKIPMKQNINCKLTQEKVLT